MESPETIARIVFRDYCHNSIPTDLLGILNEKKIKYIENELPNGILGAFVPEDPPTIIISNKIINDGLKRFSLSHELGHYFLPGHYENFIETHFSKKSVAHNQDIERQADKFAADILMPKNHFREHFDNETVTIESIINCSTQFVTSITSTSIRAANISAQPFAVVISKGSSIEYKRHTDSMAEFFKLLGISKRTIDIPSESVTSKVTNTNTIESHFKGHSDLSDWYDCDFDIQIREEAIHLGEYNKIITILTIDDDLDDILERLREDETWRPKYDMN